MDKKYSAKKKKKIAHKISKLTEKEDLVKIFEIIYEHDKSVTENNNELFMYFHNLDDEVYDKIEIVLKAVKERDKLKIDSETSSVEMYKPYVQDDLSMHNGLSPKLKYSNREKSLIKRRQYDHNINIDNEESVVYTKFNVDNMSVANT